MSAQMICSSCGYDGAALGRELKRQHDEIVALREFLEEVAERWAYPKLTEFVAEALRRER